MTPLRRRARWRRSYPIFVQLGLIGALSLLLLAFRVEWQPPAPEESFRTVAPTPPPMVEVLITRDAPKPPPPPVPPAPIEVSDETILDDEPLNFDAGLQIDDLPKIQAPKIPDGTVEEDPEVIFVVVEEMPTMIGGLKALYEKIDYPEMARRAGLEGKVIVGFVVDQQGAVSEVEVLKSVHPLLDAAAAEAVRQMRFTPGRQRGKAVRVRMSAPVTFTLR